MAIQQDSEIDTIAVLPEDVPVEMPNLPPKLVLNTPQQFKAMGDSLRTRILGIIQNQPATAKQIADRLKVPPGTIGHHLQVLEEAGLAKIVARRLVRGIVAKYYTRTARIFAFDFPYADCASSSLDILSQAHDELAEATSTIGKDVSLTTSLPHIRLSAERAQVYQERLNAIVDDLLEETPDPNGPVYGICVSMFVAPAYMQGTTTSGE